MRVNKYLSTCFLLLISIFIWNIVFINYLPKGYGNDALWEDIPLLIKYSENISKVIVLALPAIMVLSLKTKLQKIGFIIYCIGLALYFLSWIVMIVCPNCNWSESLIGFMAPAYTTIIWFVGIGLIGNQSFFKIKYLPALYISLSVFFVIIHSLHAYIVFHKL
ncbi:hypothetical protein [Aquimarina muelleri]|uniref:hypothetical protein n=1 Tax=Aquimarina muelleri TaxID=279356 RepID=UPI000429DA34|nr:hypothetical protein [Aquimarina muelleri]MCX2764697.1 hypothetical protein [Aquimarina muelleri]